LLFLALILWKNVLSTFSKSSKKFGISKSTFLPP
jgi:hypothetical protein